MTSGNSALRPRHLILDAIYDEMGGVERLERRIGIPEKTLRTWETSTHGSGREPTLLGALRILAATADEPLNATLRKLAREFVDHFAQAAHLRVSTDDPVEEIRYVLALLEQRAGVPTAVKPYHCPECGEKLKIEAFVGGAPVFGRCGNRHGEAR